MVFWAKLKQGTKAKKHRLDTRKARRAQTFINLLRGRTWNIEGNLITVGWILAVGADVRYIDYYELLVKCGKTLVITFT